MAASATFGSLMSKRPTPTSRFFWSSLTSATMAKRLEKSTLARYSASVLESLGFGPKKRKYWESKDKLLCRSMIRSASLRSIGRTRTDRPSRKVTDSRMNWKGFMGRMLLPVGGCLGKYVIARRRVHRRRVWEQKALPDRSQMVPRFESDGCAASL